MIVHLRNKASGEIRDVEADSSEFRQLQREVTSLGQPMWEQTNYAHAESVRRRAAVGGLLEEDLGYDDADELRFEALRLAAEGVAPEENPHLFLTPGEIESGLTPAQKQKDLVQMYNQRRGRRVEIYDDAAQRIAGEDYEGPDAVPALAGAADAISALAGGSDERENAPARGSLAAVSEDAGDAGQVQSSAGGPGGSRQSGARRRGGGTGGASTQAQGSSGEQAQAGSSGQQGGEPGQAGGGQ